MRDDPPPPDDGKTPTSRRRRGATSPRGRRILALTSAKNVIDHAVLAELRAFDLAAEWKLDGAVSCPTWLSWHAGMRLKTAYERLRVAHALARLPEIDDAMRRGELSYTQARAITRYPLPELQQAMLELTRDQSGEALERGLKRLRQRAAADVLLIDPRALRAAFEPLGDGSVVLRARLRPEDSSTLQRTLHGIKRLDDPNRPEALSDSEALAIMANRAARTLAGESPQTIDKKFELMLICDAEALKSGPRPPMARCELEDGTQVSVQTARRLACDAPVRALLVRKDGTPLDIGRRTARVSRALRKALIARDRHCTFPGCTSRLGLDAHHIEHWIDGGETKESNLTLLCRRHHTRVHEDHYQIVRTPRGLEFRDVNGLLLPRGPSVEAFSPSMRLDPDCYEAYPQLRAALGFAAREWLARSRGSAA